ncbi:MAG TPA: hypothetical protein PLN48_11535 [Lachnospiraceae bacterium]|nr:hypothetical protein [Lachnospiraceae bacterium]
MTLGRKAEIIEPGKKSSDLEIERKTGQYKATGLQKRRRHRKI